MTGAVLSSKQIKLRLGERLIYTMLIGILLKRKLLFARNHRIQLASTLPQFKI